MVVQAVPSWSSLSAETQEVLEWATACETEGVDVGTRAILIGILRSGQRASPADVLLRHFGVSQDALFDVLQDGDRTIDPYTTERKNLVDWPVLTPHARSCLIRAEELRADVTTSRLNVECLFGALLASDGTARSGLARVLTGVSIDEIADHYLRWFTAADGSKYAEALVEQFPVASSAAPAAAGETFWPNLAILLRRGVADGDLDRVAGLGIITQGGLLITVAGSLADRAQDVAGNLHRLTWLTGESDDLVAARLDPPPTLTNPLTMSEPFTTGPAYSYAVFDDDDNLAVQRRNGRLSPESDEPGRQVYWRLGPVPSNYLELGSPVLDFKGELAGIVESMSPNGLAKVLRSDAIEEFLSDLGSPVTASQPAVPRRSIGNASGAGNDRVAETDQLGFDVYVKAFVDLITSEHTVPPLTIGIFGSWGMGKSFLIEHIRDEVDKIDQARAGAKKRAGDGHAKPRIYSVSFNAWEYSATDAIWPALVRNIVTKLDRLSSWPWWKRVPTRFWWNLRREWRSLRTWLITAGLVLATVAALGVGKHGLAYGLGGLTTALGIRGLFKAAKDPVGKWVTGLFAGSDYGGQIDMMAEIKHDLDELERRLHVNGKSDESRLTGRILVTIDDLDRCEPAKAVEVLQAVNQLLSFPSFIVCLGIDARIITAAVDRHYEGLLGATGASGYEYLDKIVQIPFRIPEPAQQEVTRFIRSQLAVPPGSTTAEGPTDGSFGAALEAGPSQVAPSGSQPQNGSSSTEVAQLNADAGKQRSPVAPPTETPVAQPDVPFTLDEQQAFESFVPYLRPNPRHLKRLINVYRLVRSLGLANNEGLMRDHPAAVLRWLIMWAQWPFTSSLLLGKLDSAAEEAAEADHPLLWLLDKVNPSEQTTLADQDDDLAKLRGLLTVPGHVLSVEEIRRIRRYTVNFNPAIEKQLRRSDSQPSELPAPA